MIEQMSSFFEKIMAEDGWRDIPTNGERTCSFLPKVFRYIEWIRNGKTKGTSKHDLALKELEKVK